MPALKSSLRFTDWSLLAKMVALLLLAAVLPLAAVFHTIPEESLKAPMTRAFQENAVFVGAIVAFVVCAGALAVGVLIKPIRSLSKATAAIASGDLSARADATRSDEMGRLGLSVNAMAERLEAQVAALKNAHDELETRVRERTADLERTSKALKTENEERKFAERALRENQQLLHTVIDNSAAVIYVKDLAGRYILVNRRYEDIFLLKRETIVGKTDHELFPKEAADAFRAVDLRVAAGGVAVTEEEVAPHVDGPHNYISVKCPLRNADGTTFGIFGISTDITERKQAEEEVRKSEARYRTLFDTMIEGFCTIEMVFDERGKPVDFCFLETNPAFEKQTGLRNVEGKFMRDLAPNLEEHWFEIYGKIAVTGEPLQFENEARTLGRHYDVCAYRVGGPESRKVGILFNDITKRKSAEEKAQAQLARLELLNRITRAIADRQDLRSIFQVVIRSVEESLPVDFCCVCLYDPAENVVTVTSVGIGSAALALELAMSEHARIDIDQNGLSRCVRGELVYEPDVSDVSFPFPQRLARGGLRALVATPLLVESKVFGLLIAARRQPHSFSSGECEFLRQASEHVALAAHQAQLYAALQQAYDDLRQTQQAIMQQERLRSLGQMASGIAHDINNAISPAALYTESLLEKEPHLSARGREQLVIVQHALDDVAQTVARMREFYRQREPQLMLAPIDSNRLVQQVIDLTRARWSDMPQQRGIVIELVTDLQPDMPAIMGVESEIREALINLVFNAVDAMPSGGKLRLRTRATDAPSSLADSEAEQGVRIEVCDTGVGMNEDTRRRCMEPFFTTKGERGTGLGLAMVYGMVQRHSAAIEIESSLGRGTTVSLVFAVSTVAPNASDSGTASGVPSRLRLLVIDDDPLLIRSLRDTLETDGHVIVTATDGQSGIEAFRAAHARAELFDAVITDLGMPRVDGRQVASAVKNISADTPVIMLTGWGQRLVAEGDVPTHVDHVLSKPPKLRELREVLARCCPSRMS
jgi:PAS domain S-box-containing protein